MPLFELCKDGNLEKDSASGLPLKAMAAAYVANLKIASAAAKGELQQQGAAPSKVSARYTPNFSFSEACLASNNNFLFSRPFVCEQKTY